MRPDPKAHLHRAIHTPCDFLETHRTGSSGEPIGTPEAFHKTWSSKPVYAVTTSLVDDGQLLPCLEDFLNRRWNRIFSQISCGAGGLAIASSS